MKPYKEAIIESELRSNRGAYKFLVRQVDSEIDKAIKDLYNRFKGKISYDALHLLISDSSSMERLYRIAMESKI